MKKAAAQLLAENLTANIVNPAMFISIKTAIPALYPPVRTAKLITILSGAEMLSNAGGRNPEVNNANKPAALIIRILHQ